MTDLTIIVNYLSRGQLSRIGRELKEDPSNDGPGWFVRVSSNEGYTDHLKYAEVPYETVREIARMLGCLSEVERTQEKARVEIERMLKEAGDRIARDREFLRRHGR
jgi:hypothetical protein